MPIACVQIRGTAQTGFLVAMYDAYQHRYASQCSICVYTEVVVTSGTTREVSSQRDVLMSGNWAQSCTQH